MEALFTDFSFTRHGAGAAPSVRVAIPPRSLLVLRGAARFWAQESIEPMSPDLESLWGMLVATSVHRLHVAAWNSGASISTAWAAR